MADHHPTLLEVAGVVSDHAQIWGQVGAEVKATNFDAMMDIASLVFGSIGIKDWLTTFTILDQEAGKFVLGQLVDERLLEDRLNELLEGGCSSHSNKAKLHSHLAR